VTKKIQPKEGQLRIRDDLEPNSLTPRQRVFTDEEDVLYGMFTRDDIAIYFKSFDHMRTISDKINVFLENMYSNCVYMAQKERLALAKEKISDMVYIAMVMKGEHREYAQKLSNEADRLAEKYHI
jgi:hypothetical protein